MHPLIEAHREAIVRLGHLYGVRRLDALGSIARDFFDLESSDVDLVAEFGSPPMATS